MADKTMAFNARKSAQSIAYLCILNGRQSLKVLKAIKLIYIADRESIRERGFPIQQDRYVSMPHGPVNSMVLGHIDGFYEDRDGGWAQFLSDKRDHAVGLAQATIGVEDLDELSPADRAVLDRVWLRFRAMSQFEIRDWTHDPKNIPEWQDPNGSSIQIPIASIYRAVGADPELALAFADMTAVDELFARL